MEVGSKVTYEGKPGVVTDNSHGNHAVAVGNETTGYRCITMQFDVPEEQLESGWPDSE